MSETSFFTGRIADTARRARMITDQAATQPSLDQRYIGAALEELNAALEELRVADEELRQQNAELERAAERAEFEHQRYYSLFEFAPVGLLTTDAHGIIREANRAACLLLICERPHLIGKPIAALLDNESSREVRQLLPRAFSTSGPASCWITTSPGRGAARRLIATLEADTTDPRNGPRIRWGLQPRTPLEGDARPVPTSSPIATPLPEPPPAAAPAA